MGKIEKKRKELETEEEKIMEDARKTIQKAIDERGRYSHNIVTLTLKYVAENISFGHANSLVDEFDLEYEFQIFKEFPDKKKLADKLRGKDED